MHRAFSLFKQTNEIEHALARKIEVADWETKIFRFLRRVAAATKTTEQVELRVAGGWVRDKLLKRNTGDIDIAVQHATGFQFATRLHEFAAKKAIEYDRGTSVIGELPNVGCAEYIPEMSSVAVIAANPAMSRHLETATVRLDGHDLDFVQLRTEDYALSSDNRIPENVAVGTPAQDSSRRDFTVNALFYNLRTERVEDYTGHGLQDLKDAVLRTPLHSRVTLLEDPLRAVRAIRFACRLQFNLHPKLAQALSERDVHDSLHRKVSRERIGCEIMQVIESQEVINGLKMIAEHNLVEPIFLQSFAPRNGMSSNYDAAIERVQEALRIHHLNERVFENVAARKEHSTCRKEVILAALIWDANRTRLLLHDALRREKQLCRDVRQILILSTRLKEVALKWFSDTSDDFEHLQASDLWIAMAEIVREAGGRLWDAVCVICSMKMKRDGLLHELFASGICEDICSVKHAVDGKRLQAELGIRQGPEVGKALRDLMRLQLLEYRRRAVDSNIYEDAASAEPSPDECINMLKVARAGAGGAS